MLLILKPRLALLSGRVFLLGDELMVKNTQWVLSAVAMAMLVGCGGKTSVRYDSDPHYYHSDHHHYKSGPPPHAPAHGYRHKHHNHQMIYDSGIRAYIVVGWHDHYYDNGFYFRYRDGHWQISANLESGWKATHEHRVPKTLWSSKAKKRSYHDDRSRDKYQDKRYDREPQRYNDRHKQQSRNDYNDRRDTDRRELGYKDKHDKNEHREKYDDDRRGKDYNDSRGSEQRELGYKDKRDKNDKGNANKHYKDKYDKERPDNGRQDRWDD